MAHMGTRPGNTQWLFCTSSLVEMFGQYRSGAVSRCVSAGSCQIVKCCFVPGNWFLGTRYLDARFRYLSLLISRFHKLQHGLEFSLARLASGRLNFILPHLRPFSWFSSFLLILFFSPSCCISISCFFSLSCLCSSVHLFCTDFFSPFPSVIVPLNHCHGSLLPAFLCSVWCLLLFCILFGAFCPCFSALGWSICAFPASVIWLHGSSQSHILWVPDSWLFPLSLLFWHKGNPLWRVRWDLEESSWSGTRLMKSRENCPF